MQKPFAIALAVMTSAFAAGAWLAPAFAQGQAETPEQAAARARQIAAAFEANASVLTVYDREGTVARTVGERGIYSWPALSPDGTRLAVSRRDATTNNTEIWVIELSTGAGMRITSGSARVETSPVWSPDGSQIAYASNPGGSPGLYRRAADGSGSAELLYQHLTGPNLTDWSPDGRFLTFYDATSLYLLPIAGPGERRAIEVLPGSSARGGRFSPDGRSLAYVSSQSGRGEIWIRPLDPAAPDGPATAAGPRQISDQGGVGMVFWRQDGQELYYLGADQDVMAVEVNAAALASGTPRRLFTAPYRMTGTISGATVSRDGQQFLFNIGPTPPDARTLAVYDRDGRRVATLGERHPYLKPVFSPDEARVAVIVNYQSNADLWVFDVASGAGTRIARLIVQELSEMSSFVWSPDGRQLAYVALRGSYYGIYRKSATGDGNEELVYQHSGTPLLTDWSPDGRYLGFFTWETPGATMSVVAVDGRPGAREPAEILSSESGNLMGPFFSPDGRFIAYQSGNAGLYSIWVRGFDPGSPRAAARTWQVSDSDAWGNDWDWYGDVGKLVWPAEGHQLYYVSADLGVMAAEVTVGRDFEASRPGLLFEAPPMAELGHVSRDGERFLFAVPPAPPLNQITLFDRAGKELRRVGEPGLYGSAALSPDASKVAATRRDPQTGRPSVWTFDVATGRGTQVTTTPDGPHDALVQWSPDGAHVAYVSPAGCEAQPHCDVYRKAWNGVGTRELLFRGPPGVPMESLNFSADGRFLSFQSGSALFVVPLTGRDPLAREAIAFPLDEFERRWPTFSPDSRFIAYMSTESGGRTEYYVRSFDATTGNPGAEQWRITTHGPAVGGSAWRPDGGEILYTRRLNDSPPPEGRVEVMAIGVTTSPTFQAGEPRVLFTLPALAGSFTSRASQSFTYDGEVFVALVAAPSP
jgi:Tol biopolymer transport system component